MSAQLFDLMPAEGEEAAATVARRMAAVPQAYRQFSQTLLGAARNGRPRPGCRSRRSPSSAPPGPRRRTPSTADW